jgi:hypothetical protein
MLAPGMTTAQRNAIASPADGLIVYDIYLKSFYFYVSTTTSKGQRCYFIIILDIGCKEFIK